MPQREGGSYSPWVAHGLPQQPGARYGCGVLATGARTNRHVFWPGKGRGNGGPHVTQKREDATFGCISRTRVVSQTWCPGALGAGALLTSQQNVAVLRERLTLAGSLS